MKIIKWLGIALIALIAVLLFNTLRVPTFEPRVAQKGPLLLIDEEGANQRLSKALQFRTVSIRTTSGPATKPFQQFNQWLTEAYPVFHEHAQRELINTLSPLYTLQGSNPALKPILFAAHTDVVPAREDANSGWRKPPFSGEISEGAIWGRGAFDDKGSVIGLLEAAEHLLKAGFKPERTIYFAFGHDEEIGGFQGAVKIVEHLQAQGVQLEFMLDEGGQLTQHIVAGVDFPVANINPIEKGYATFTFTVKELGGHSSVPPRDTAVARLARAILKVNENRLPAEIVSPVDQLLKDLAPAMSFGQRLVIANLWLFEPVVLKMFGQKNTTAAMTQTTVAPTIFQSGHTENVLPRKASATINFRLLPGTTLQSLGKYLEDTVNDPAVNITLNAPFQSDPSPLSSQSNRAWDLLYSTTAKYFPSAVIAPNLTVGATDARHYAAIADDQYRFLPIILTPDDISGFHGKNERISIQNWHRMVRWYIDFISVASKAAAEE
ncbi:MAG: M20 family peptidase [Gammaproteobacteria bacterium]|nr:M20 family peptidase [Gammaproteobacteria bacterium]